MREEISRIIREHIATYMALLTERLSQQARSPSRLTPLPPPPTKKTRVNSGTPPTPTLAPDLRIMREIIRDLQRDRRQQDQELARLTAELRTLRLSSPKSTPSQHSQSRALVLRAGSQPSDWYPPDTPSTQLLPAPPRPPVIPIYLYDSSSDEEPSLPFDQDPPESPVSQQELCPACGDLETCPECGLLLFGDTSQSEDLEEQEEL